MTPTILDRLKLVLTDCERHALARSLLGSAPGQLVQSRGGLKSSLVLVKRNVYGQLRYVRQLR